ncbi:adhesion G-protein coupled receptor G2 [Acanthopagrus latus]|uniref:adhesion G-protein coupled receptor G2 n=1 Tax=Acanthopagrus latus TaxID=8177 RepID=UPI00187CFDD3|nr:adhesion G-protein coupled receptor G2 [Acanthopagrus latus]
MVPLLLFMLLQETLADKVHLDISNNVIHAKMTGVDIVDDLSGNVRCVVGDLQCFFHCVEFNIMAWFSGSSVNFEADVNNLSDKIVYSFSENGGKCTLYPCKANIIVPLITQLDGGSFYQKEMIFIHSVRDSCPQLFSSSYEVSAAFITVERQIIHNIVEATRLEAGGSKHYNLRVLSLNVVSVSEANHSSLETNSLIAMEAPQLLPQNKSTIPDIWLPVEALKKKSIIGLVSYMRHSQFQFGDGVISSMVVRIEVMGERLHNLKNPIKMIFRILQHTNMGNDSRLQCHYFDEHDLTVPGNWWKTDGCETLNMTNNNQTDIICNCNHATPFAVLLIREEISGIHWKILSYISYVGCSLSALFTALSLVMYVFTRKHKMDYSISIHVSLSGALLLLNTTFLLTEWGATVKPDWVCVFIAAFMHYSLLCCFTWMAIEALHLYLLLIKVFNTYYKHYLIKLSLAGWGIPGVIVAVSLGLKDFKQFYGVTQVSMANTDQTSAICWITDESFFYSLTLVYFTLIFIFNTGILMTVASSICKMKQAFRSNSNLGGKAEGKTRGDPQRFRESCRSGLTMLGLTCLMGTTWGLAFLGSGYVNYPILYLFCILNSTQGFFIFLWICLSAKKQRKRDMEVRMSSSPGKTSATKSD